MSIAKTRQKLIEVARDLFAHNGLEATTMNDIAQASGKGRRTLYTYFRNKEEIYKAVVEEELERLSERMELVAAQDAAPERKILTLIYAHLNAMRETVARNGSLRAEFFRNIWNVEKVRRAFDIEELNVLERVLTIAGGLCLIVPGTLTDAIGLALIALGVVLQIVLSKKQKA